MEMRNFTEDKKILALINAIEQHLGSKINAAPMDSVDMGMEMTAGMRPCMDGWEFLYNPQQNKYESDILFHELMHVSMCIEGWPTYKIKINGKYAHELSETEKSSHRLLIQAGTNLMNASLHIEVWKRSTLCGFSESKRIEIEFKKIVIPELQTPLTAQEASEEWREALGSVVLAHAFLAPVSQSVHRILLQSSRRHFSQSLVRAQAIVRVLRGYSKLFPQALGIALAEAQQTAKFPSGILQLEFPSMAYPAYFSQTLLPVLKSLSNNKT